MICINYEQVVMRVKNISLYRKRAVYFALICENLIFLKETELPPFQGFLDKQEEIGFNHDLSGQLA